MAEVLQNLLWSFYGLCISIYIYMCVYIYIYICHKIQQDGFKIIKKQEGTYSLFSLYFANQFLWSPVQCIRSTYRYDIHRSPTCRNSFKPPRRVRGSSAASLCPLPALDGDGCSSTFSQQGLGMRLADAWPEPVPEN